MTTIGHAPTWQAERAERSRRQAKTQPCPKCGVDTLVGPNDDDLYWIARVDTDPVDRIHEVAGALAGRFPHELIRGALYLRRDHDRGRPSRHPVHLTHACAPRAATDAATDPKEQQCLF